MIHDCEGCGKEDCEPQYHSYVDLMLCDYCFDKASDEESEYDYDDDYYDEDSFADE